MKLLTAVIILTLVLNVCALPLLPKIGKPPRARIERNLILNNNPLRAMYKALNSAKPKEYLDAHNAFRQKFGLPPLQWDAKLEAYSRDYAATLSKTCSLKHSNGPYGENIAWEQYAQTKPAQFVKKFTNEQMNYDLQHGVCKCRPNSSCMCGHFTQIIWKTTQRVGCAESACFGEKGKLVVCSYDPKGNILGRNPLNP